MPDKWRILAARHQLSVVPRQPSLTRHPDHLDAEVGGELAQVSLLGHLAVLGVGDEVRGHRVLISDHKVHLLCILLCCLLHLAVRLRVVAGGAGVAVYGVASCIEQ